MSDNIPHFGIQERFAEIFTHLRGQDIEQFYAHYQLWVMRHRVSILENEIETLRADIAENQQRVQTLRPSAIALAVLARLQSNGVSDIALLDQMLERGEDWLDRMMQRLDYCEQVEDFIQGDYTQWCVNSLEGAYDWIDSLRGSPKEEESAPQAVADTSEAEVQATAELLLHKLSFDDEETMQEATHKHPALNIPALQAANESCAEELLARAENPTYAEALAMLGTESTALAAEISTEPAPDEVAQERIVTPVLADADELPPPWYSVSLEERASFDFEQPGSMNDWINILQADAAVNVSTPEPEHAQAQTSEPPLAAATSEQAEQSEPLQISAEAATLEPMDENEAESATLELTTEHEAIPGMSATASEDEAEVSANMPSVGTEEVMELEHQASSESVEAALPPTLEEETPDETTTGTIAFASEAAIIDLATTEPEQPAEAISAELEQPAKAEEAVNATSNVELEQPVEAAEVTEVIGETTSTELEQATETEEIVSATGSAELELSAETEEAVNETISAEPELSAEAEETSSAELELSAETEETINAEPELSAEETEMVGTGNEEPEQLASAEEVVRADEQTPAEPVEDEDEASPEAIEEAAIINVIFEPEEGQLPWYEYLVTEKTVSGELQSANEIAEHILLVEEATAPQEAPSDETQPISLKEIQLACAESGMSEKSSLASMDASFVESTNSDSASAGGEIAARSIIEELAEESPTLKQASVTFVDSANLAALTDSETYAVEEAALDVESEELEVTSEIEAMQEVIVEEMGLGDVVEEITEEEVNIPENAVAEPTSIVAEQMESAPHVTLQIADESSSAPTQEKPKKLGFWQWLFGRKRKKRDISE